MIKHNFENCTDKCSYGPAPHTCFYKIKGATMGQSKPLPENEWPDNFEPDPKHNGLGIHHECGWSKK